MTILRIRKLLADRPTLVTFGLVLTIVLFIGAAIGMLSDQQQSHEALAAANKHAGCHTCGSSAEWAPVHYTNVIN